MCPSPSISSDEASTSVIEQAPCFTILSCLGLGCMCGCAMSSAIRRKAWPRSLVGVYILMCCHWLLELGCTPRFVFLGCAMATPPSTIRKRPASAMVESGPAAVPASYKSDAPWYAGLAPEMPQWRPHAHSQPFPETNGGITLSRHSCRMGTCRFSRPSR